MNPVRHFTNLTDATTWALAELPEHVVMATPLGLGKPNPMVNAIYARIKMDPKRRLDIFTALSLAVPRASSELQRRFLDPFRKRHWGEDYPELEYLKDLDAGQLPKNIRVREFYLQAGKAVGRPEIQRDYISVNYTHVPHAIVDRGINVLLQMVARHPQDPNRYSLSCNPDLTLDVHDLYAQLGKKLMILAVVHPDLPYCTGDSEVSADFFSAVIDAPEMKHTLFALPRQPIRDSDYLIGLHASLLIADGGTLQIGIGSLSEALVYCTKLRQTDNALYREICTTLLNQRPYARNPQTFEHFHMQPFSEGVYGTSEMVMDGFMHLRNVGVLKREVFELDRKVRRYLHGAFYLGSKDFYAWLRELYLTGDTGLNMTRVSRVNDLYDADEMALRRQRVKARFFNSCMQVTLLGAAASDTTEAGQVVSGVGGQYNFVAMSHELPDSFSVLMLNSLRHSTKGTSSNFVWGHGQLTIPRHLRDVVISEYGIAFLKNRSDEEVIQALLSISDNEFTDDLQNKAIKERKLSPNWQRPDWTANNNSQWPTEFLKPWKAKGLFPDFPFGSDFTPEEEKLAVALTILKHSLNSKVKLLKILGRGINTDKAPHQSTLERMQLWSTKNPKDWLYQKLLLGVLGK